jgi:hypothetical protein
LNLHMRNSILFFCRRRWKSSWSQMSCYWYT